MYHSGAVRLMERIRDGDGDRHSLIQIQWFAIEPFGERLAFQILQDEEIDAVMLPDIVHGANMGMMQGGDGQGCAVELFFPGWKFGDIGPLRRDHLNGNRAARLEVRCFVYLDSVSRADGREDLVGTQFRAWFKRHSASRLYYLIKSPRSRRLRNTNFDGGLNEQHQSEGERQEPYGGYRSGYSAALYPAQ